MDSSRARVRHALHEEDRSGTGVPNQSSPATDLIRQHYDEGFYQRQNRQTNGGGSPQPGSTAAAKFVAPENPLPNQLITVLRGHRPETVSFYALQEWDGYVLELGTESFRARLTDLTKAGPPDREEAEIPYSELDEESRSMLAPGRIFRWAIGYERSRSGQKTRVSRIVFRRLPAWSPSELQKAKADAATAANTLKWD